jgi:YVTN family beta-propeller protein
MKKRLVVLALLMLAFQLTASTPANAAAAEPYGLGALLQLDRLPYLKSDTLAGGQSSYDRYGGNIDSNNYLSSEPNGDKVLLDLQGPGVVYRMWFTGFIPEQASIRVYFDGEAVPRIDMLIDDLAAGNHPPFLAPLVGNERVSSGGYYSYVPLPFSKSIKIVTNQNALWFYYNIGYHLFSPDTPVTTWSPSQDMSGAQNLWSRAGIDPKSDGGGATTTGTVNLTAGSTQTLVDLAGPRSISSIRLRVPGIAPGTIGPETTDILNNTWVRIYWDDESSPGVSAPIGSFFAMGQFGASAPRSLMVGMDDAGNLYIYFPMPFQHRARIQLASTRSTDTNNISFEIKHAPFAASFANVGYFKTAYIFQTRYADDGKDILMLDVEGAGQLVGIVASFAGPPNVFMEGDERIYIDDSQTPAIQGTGTEDFFNGGWYFKRGLFTLPTHGLTTHSPSGGLDRIAAYRLFLSDAIPFRKHLRVGMEHGNRNAVTMSAWTLAYYYAQPTARAVLSDVLDVGKSASESSHAYTVDHAMWSGTQGFTYDGVMDAYGSLDDGRAHRGSSQFQLAIDPSNDGVLLRRKLDQGIANQQAMVFVDGQPVGIWYTAGGNPYHRWRDDDFLIPAAYTRGKRAITIRIADASPDIAWTEFQYAAYSIVNPLTPVPLPTVTPTRAPTASPTFVSTATPLPIPTSVPTPTPPAQVCAPPSVIATIPVGASPKGIAVDAATHRVFVGLFDDSNVAVIDTNSNREIAVWSTRHRGHANSVAMSNGHLFVSLRDSASVAVLDAATGAFIGTIPVGGMPYGMSAAGNRVWVANFASGSVSVLDAATNSPIATTPIGDRASFVVADGARALASYYGGGVAVIDGDGALVNQFAPLGTGAFGLALNAATQRLYVGNRDERVLWVVDPTSGSIVKGVALPAAPYALTLNPLTNRLFIVLADANQVDVRDGATLERVAILPIGIQGNQGGDGIAAASGRIYVSNNAEGTLSVIADSCGR